MTSHEDWLQQLCTVYSTTGCDSIVLPRSELGATISPSAIATWQRCPREMAFSNALVQPRVEKPSQILGTDTHKAGEQYQKEGTTPDCTTVAGRLFAEGLHYLPKPKTHNVFAEREFHLEHNGVIYTGSIDLLDLSWLTHANPVIWDYKTTGRVEYALTQPQMISDPQVALYSLAGLAMSARPALVAVAKWLYFDTKSKKCLPPRQAYVSKDACIGTLDKLESAAIEVAAFRTRLWDGEFGAEGDVVRRLAVINAEIRNDPSQCMNSKRACEFQKVCVLFKPRSNDMIDPKTGAEETKLAKLLRENKEKKEAAAAAPAPATPAVVSRVEAIKQSLPVNPPEVATALPAAIAEANASEAPAVLPTADEAPKGKRATRKAIAAEIAPSNGKTTADVVMQCLVQGLEVQSPYGLFVIRLASGND